MRRYVVVRNVTDEIQNELRSLLDKFTATLEREQAERSKQLRNEIDISVHNYISSIAIAMATVSLRDLIERRGSVESLGFIFTRLSNQLKAAHIAASRPGGWSFPKETLATLRWIKNALERR